MGTSKGCQFNTNKWLRNNMLPLLEETVWEKTLHPCRAYVLSLNTSVLMPDKACNKVHIKFITFEINRGLKPKKY